MSIIVPSTGPTPGNIANASIDALELAIESISEEGPDLITLAELLADLVLILVGVFEGKPRNQDTLTVATRLMHSQNPAGWIWGDLIYRLLNDEGIVLSSSSAADQAKLGTIRGQFAQNLQNQGITQARTQNIIDEFEKYTTSPTQAVPPELKVQLTPDQHLWGPQQLLDDYNTQLQDGLNKGLTLKKATRRALRYIFTKEPIAFLQTIEINPTNPHPPISVPPGPPPLPPMPPPGGQLGPPTQQPGGDELTDCCYQTATYLYAIAQAIQNWAGTQPSGGGDDCCTNLVAAINAVVAQLAAISGQLPGAGGGAAAPPDLSAIVAALGNLVTATLAYPPAIAALTGTTANGLEQIVAQLAKMQPTDVSGIVAQLAKLFSTIDVPIGVYQELTNQGFMTPADLQLVGSGEFGAGLIALFRTFAWRALTWFLSTMGITLDATGWHFASASDALAADLGGLFSRISTTGDTAFAPIVTTLVGKIVTLLTPRGVVTPGAIGVSPDAPVATAIAAALGMAVAAWIASFAGVNTAESLVHLSELMAGAIGFEELRDVQVGPYVRNGIAKVADLQAKRIFRQEIPGPGEVASWSARGLMDPSSAKFLAQLNGIDDTLIVPQQAAAYGGMQSRQLIRLIETGLFTTSDIQDELTFSGMRPASQSRMLLAAPYLATQTQRSSLLAELNSAYVAGLLSDSDLTSQVDSAWQNSDRDSLALARAQLAKRVAIAKDLEAEYTTLYLAGLLDDGTYRGNLSGIGLQDDMVAAIAAKAEARANATLQKKTIAAAAALARTTAAEERKTAMKAYATGTVDAAGLLAALLLTGLTTTQAAAWVSLAALQKAGTPRWTYGLQLQPGAATLLRSRVAALLDQRKRLLTTAPEFLAALQALGIPPDWINSLIATADAMITPKTSAFLSPVSTS